MDFIDPSDNFLENIVYFDFYSVIF